MSARAFRLASLLRLRRAQEDQAAAELARAAALRLAASERAERRQAELAGHRVPGECTPTAWTASVAARAALVVVSRQADADREEAALSEDGATRTWRETRRSTAALEHLEERHAERVARQDLRDEQLRIDEHTAATAPRTSGEST